MNTFHSNKSNRKIFLIEKNMDSRSWCPRLVRPCPSGRPNMRRHPDLPCPSFSKLSNWFLFIIQASIWEIQDAMTNCMMRTIQRPQELQNCTSLSWETYVTSYLFGGFVWDQCCCILCFVWSQAGVAHVWHEWYYLFLTKNEPGNAHTMPHLTSLVPCNFWKLSFKNIT